MAGAAEIPHSPDAYRVVEARDPGAFGPDTRPGSVVAV